LEREQKKPKKKTKQALPRHWFSNSVLPLHHRRPSLQHVAASTKSIKTKGRKKKFFFSFASKQISHRGTDGRKSARQCRRFLGLG
jgi:hypothetical protein